jgi:hypothetical protein
MTDGAEGPARPAPPASAVRRRPPRPFEPERGQFVVLAVVLWLVVAWNLSAPGLRDRMGQVKGTDFFHFYELGLIARTGQWHIMYDADRLLALGETLVPSPPRYISVYSPTTAIAFAPFSTLPYGAAYAAWLLVGGALLGASAWRAWKASPHLRSSGATIALAVAGAPATVSLAMFGQTSGVAAAMMTAAGLAYVSHRRLACGVALGVLIYKPQLLLAPGVLFLVAREWRVLGGMALGACLNLGVGWITAGTPVMYEYLLTVRHIGAIRDALMPKPWQMHTLHAFAGLLFSPTTALVLGWGASLGALAASSWAWGRIGDRRWRWSILSVATVLCADHLTVYDLVILLPAFVWTADWLAANPDAPRASWLRASVGASYLLPLANPLAQLTHLQVSVLALAAWLALLIGRAREFPDAGSVAP